MPSELFLETIEIDVEIAEALPIDANATCYPLPSLVGTGKYQKVELEAVLLENAFLRVTVIPALGGRIWSIFHKGQNREAIPQSGQLKLSTGGPRGVWLDAGIQFWPGEDMARNSLAPVEFDLREAEGEDDPATVLLFDLIPGLGLSYHASISLKPDQAQVEIAVRLLNRNLTALPYTCSFQSSSEFVRLYPEGELFEHEDNGVFRRFAKGDALAPRQTDSFSLSVVPSFATGIDHHQSGLTLTIGDKELTLETSLIRPKSRMFLGQPDGQTLEATFDLYPENPQVVTYESLGGKPIGVVVRDLSGNDLLTWSKVETGKIKLLGSATGTLLLSPPADSKESKYNLAFKGTSTEADLNGVFSVPALASPARIVVAMRKLAAGDPNTALALLTDAVNTNAEDPLTWWLVCVAKRHANIGSEENAELLNAHYLSPMEPVLRAESFLASPISNEQARVLEPLKSCPESAIEIACLYVEAGLFADSVRLIGELRRQMDLPMLKLLEAYCYKVGSRMDVQAAELMTGIKRSDLTPWRRIEIEACKRLYA